jgi:hypothetical protein
MNAISAKKKTTLPTNWDEIRHRTICDDGGKCCMCGSKKKLTIHHRDENESNNDPTNLMTLCFKCHDKMPTHLFDEDYDCRTKTDGDGNSMCLRLGPAAGNIGPKNCPYYSNEHGCMLEYTKVLPEENIPDQSHPGWRGWEKFIAGKRFPKILPVENKESPQPETFSESPRHFEILSPPEGEIPWFVKSRLGWERWWWKKSIKLCQRCRRDCKQSWRVVVNRCPQFEPRSERRANV